VKCDEKSLKYSMKHIDRQIPTGRKPLKAPEKLENWRRDESSHRTNRRRLLETWRLEQGEFFVTGFRQVLSENTSRLLIR